MKQQVKMTAESRIAEIGKALAHPVRVKMLRLLADSERCGCEFAPILQIDPSVVSRYLAVLARAGLVTSRRDGVRVMWRLIDSSILDILEEIEDLAATHEVAR
jgi:DNA-binding transcriptional ArsR family regulator